MKLSMLLIVIGAAAILPLLVAQVRWLHLPPKEMGWRRAWNAAVLAMLFGAFAWLHALLVESERPPPDPNLRLLPFEEEMRPVDASPPPDPPASPPRPRQ
jgi:hypothetical protein